MPTLPTACLSIFVLFAPLLSNWVWTHVQVLVVGAILPGRMRVQGKRLPTLEASAHQRTTRWKRGTLPDWYGEGARTIEIASKTAVWYHAGQPRVPIRTDLLRPVICERSNDRGIVKKITGMNQDEAQRLGNRIGDRGGIDRCERVCGLSLPRAGAGGHSG